MSLKNKNNKEKYEKQLKDLIFNKLQLSKNLIDLKVEKPNINCKIEAEKICKNIYKNYNIKPNIIKPSPEGGIFIEYNNTSNISFILEVYNNLYVAGLVNDNKQKKILFSKSFLQNNKDTEIFLEFYYVQ